MTKTRLTMALLADADEASLLRIPLADANGSSVEISAFSDNQALLAAIGGTDPDLILMDVQIRDRHAREMIPQLRRDGIDEPVVVLVTEANRMADSELKKAGAYRCVVRDENLAQAIVDTMDDLEIEAEEGVRGHHGPDEARQSLSKREAMESMCRGLSHGLMSSMTSVQEFLSIVLDELGGPLTAEQRQYLEVARNSCGEFRGQLQDLIAIAEMEGCGLVIRPKVLAMNRVVEEVVRDMSSIARDRRVKLRYEVEVGLAPVMADGAQIKKAIELLLNTALQVSPASAKILVAVQASEVFDGGNEVSIQFSGPAITSEEELQHIFDLHYQVQKTSEGSSTDFGFGLHMCKEIVNLHGGRIVPRAIQGRVSAFVFDLRGVMAGAASETELAGAGRT